MTAAQSRTSVGSGEVALDAALVQFGREHVLIELGGRVVLVETVGWGRASATSTAGVIVGSASRVTYEHPEFQEWFVLEAQGLEHGFTIPAAPEGQGELVLDVRFGGDLHPVLDRHGNVVLLDAEERREGHYTHLHAFDDDGDELPSWFSVSEDVVRIHVDDEGARYPVTVDPLLWGKVQTVVPSLGTPQDLTAVATDGDTSLLAARAIVPDANGKGVVFVFDRVGGVWTESQVLRPAGVYGDISFGFAVSVWNDRAAITSLGNSTTPGKVYFFEKTGGSWTFVTDLTPPDAVPGDRFGEHVVIKQDRVFVSAHKAEIAGQVNAGAVYTFTRQSQTWGYDDKLTEPTPAADSYFGTCIDARSDQYVVAGAPGSPLLGGPVLGAVYEFRDVEGMFPGEKWWIKSFTPPVGPSTVSPLFGNGCAYGQWSIFVGAPLEYNFFGSVYQFYADSIVETFVPLNSATMYGAPMAGSSNYVAVGYNGAIDVLRKQSSPPPGVPQWSLQQAQLQGDHFDISDTTLATYPGHFYELAYENGDVCSSDGECLSDHCADGVCCDAACGGTCEACDLPQSVGTCTVRAAGDPGDPVCVPYLCDGGATSCPTQCGVDVECVTTHFCDAGSCAPKGVPGDSCAGSNGCLSGACVDGVCCATPCDVLCEACDVTGHEGGCWPLPSGSDPDAECADGACNGAGVCASDAGVACSVAGDCLSGFCIDGVCCDSACDDGCEACDLAGTVGTCAAIATGEDPADECVDGACDGSGACRLALGVSCGYDEACLSGFCVDGVCCDAACGGSEEGDCQACSVSAGAASDGACAPLSAGTVCREADSVCGGEESCDGVGVACPTDLAAPDGTGCDDEDACTSGDSCQRGICVGGEDVCGTGGAGGTGAPGGADGSGGFGAGGNDAGGLQVNDGCGCRTVSSPGNGRRGWPLVALGLAVAARRRRRGRGRGLAVSTR